MEEKLSGDLRRIRPSLCVSTSTISVSPTCMKTKTSSADLTARSSPVSSVPLLVLQPVSWWAPGAAPVFVKLQVMFWFLKEQLAVVSCSLQHFGKISSHLKSILIYEPHCSVCSPQPASDETVDHVLLIILLLTASAAPKKDLIPKQWNRSCTWLSWLQLAHILTSPRCTLWAVSISVNVIIINVSSTYRRQMSSEHSWGLSSGRPVLWSFLYIRPPLVPSHMSRETFHLCVHLSVLWFITSSDRVVSVCCCHVNLSNFTWLRLQRDTCHI